MSKEKSLNIRSPQVNEILSNPPNWMIRWGITLIFGVVIVGLLLSWFIKYPDVVKGPVEITTKIPLSFFQLRLQGN